MSYSRNYRRLHHGSSYDQNLGVPGVVYILTNEAFKDGWLKIGCTRHSGDRRAAEMNRDSGTGLPAHHVCIFEQRTLDCQRSEMAVHKALASFRTGRQEFFKVDIELARKTIVQECARIDLETNARAEVESKLRRDADIAEQRARAERFAEARRLRDAEVAARQSQQISADLSTTEDREAEAVARQPDARNIESEQSGWPVSFLFLLLLVLGLLALGKATRPADAPSESVPAHYSVSPSPSAAAVLTTAEAERRQPQSEEPKGSTSEVAMKSEEQRLRHVAIKALEIQARRDAEAASDMRVIQDRALQDYPLLGTPAGRPIWEKMIQRRDELVKQGVYPSIAMTRAVQAFAPELPLTDASSMRSIVVPEPNAEQRSKDDSCRWNTPTSWKCD